MKRKAFIIADIVLTSVYQATGAPILDACIGHLEDGRTWRGYALHLSPWRKNSYGDRAGGIALCIGRVRK